MAYVSELFKHDIFVSYSHGSDSRGDASLQEWSIAFVRELENELRADRDYRDALAVFMDAHQRDGQKLDPTLPLDADLEAQAGASALLLALVSPDYRASKWCEKERAWWLERQRRIGLSPTGRIALVHMWPASEPWPGGRWPPELSDSTGNPFVGYPFHVGEGRKIRPWGWSERSAGFSAEVRKKIQDVAGDLYRVLDQIKADAAQLQACRDDTRRLSQPGGQTLYLHGRADQAADWDRAAEALADGGYAVFPGEPDPVERDPARLEAIRSRRVETMSDCDALVLLGSRDGRAIDADLVVVGKHDRQSARARSNRWLPCALLDIAGGAVATHVRRTTARTLQTDWIDVMAEPVVPLVKKWLHEKAAQADAP